MLLLFSLSDYIGWHGRYCAFDYLGGEMFLQHAINEMMGHECKINNCDLCRKDIQLDIEDVGKCCVFFCTQVFLAGGKQGLMIHLYLSVL